MYYFVFAYTNHTFNRCLNNLKQGVPPRGEKSHEQVETTEKDEQTLWYASW